MMWSKCSWSASLHRAVNVWAASFWLHVALIVWRKQLPKLYTFAAQLWAARPEFAIARLTLEVFAFYGSGAFAQPSLNEEVERMLLDGNMEQNLQATVQQLIQAADIDDIDFSSFGSNDCLVVFKTQLGIKLDTSKTSALVWSASQEGPPLGASPSSTPLQVCTVQLHTNVQIAKLSQSYCTASIQLCNALFTAYSYGKLKHVQTLFK